ncbi:disease resistance protein RGA5-like [Phragmites australis]|uniref:disease resistance protein RGA5-like n=1 Tax=Phragmites australis TaxID=29695 RepID=UPI002D788D99|nr:disease resistance protein RGA5-like [Phragmites australis]XP_062197778.1 disease resistance protein RGA5-like [Phragmites australis]XP_062197779.1 disease resistance protein RGA5-like [Phragmites australis]
MDLVTGAMGSLAAKLRELLKEEYNLQKVVKKQVESLSRELEIIHTALCKCKVSDLPPDQLDPQVSWVREVTEASYEMELVIDTFLKSLKECPEPADSDGLKGCLQKMGSLFNKGKALHGIASAIEDMEDQLQEKAEQRGKLKVDDIVPKPSVTSSSTIDPYILALYTHASLDGVDEPRDALVRMLSVVDNDACNKKMKILSIVRSEGLGKTSLAQEVFDKLLPQFDCGAFVQVGQNPDLRKVFTDILVGLDNQKYKKISLMILDLMELMGLLRKSLINKRFFVVVDDIWDSKAWEIIKCALIENSNGSAVLTTSRDTVITEFIGGKLPPLSATDSKKIFCKKLFGSEDKCPPELENISEKLIETCDGILSVIIDTVELLASKPSTAEDWQAVYDRRILALSYPDLPDYLKNCLLYLSMFQKGYEISGERLVWGWIAEGFVQEAQGQTLQEVGESYLSELIKKKMIEAVEVDADGKALSCRGYNFGHDFIISKSTEANFVTILDGPQGRSLPDTVHRLSIQKNNVVHSLPQGRLSLVRSLVVSGDSDTMPSLSDFPYLRVLDLGGCDSLQDDHLKGIHNSRSLKYLVIGGKCITGIPKEIMNLNSLQTLDLSASGLNELPESVFFLRQLERLCVNSHMKIPDGIGKMSSLQELGDINISKPELLKELCNLTKLWVLRIAIWSWDESLKSSVKQLQDNLRSLVQFKENIQSLSILTCCSLDFMDDLGAEWAPPSLQKLEIRYSCFDAKPRWIDSLQNLSSLSIEVYKLSQEIIDRLGELPTLYSFSLTSKHAPQGKFGIDSDRFKNLANLQFASKAMLKMFAPETQGMQKLKRLTLLFQASRTEDINRDFSFGLENLCSLEHVRVEIICSNASRRVVETAEAAIRKAISTDRSCHPDLEIRRVQEESMIAEGETKYRGGQLLNVYQQTIPVPQYHFR